MTTTPAAGAAAAAPRLDAVDCVRGVVMVLMFLDHSRDFTHWGALVNDPLDLTRTTPILYLTRWVTHLCAPTFVFLAGLGAGLQRLRGKPPGPLARFLWTRGLWLVLLEVTVVRALIWFNLDPSLLAHLQVIFAIGVSMVLLAALVRLPPTAVGAAGVVLVLGHNLLDAFQATPWRGPGSPVPSAMGKLWMLVHQGGFFPAVDFPGPMVLAQYPILPWLGILLAGYGAALVYAWPLERRRPFLVAVGSAMLVVFIALRYSNLYGDPAPWQPAGDLVRTAMSFLNVQKYPPSALFALVTLGVAILALGALDGRSFGGGLGKAAVVFGRVPLFFYLLQWIAAHVAGIVVTAVRGKDLAPYFLNFVQLLFSGNPPDMGGPLRVTYLCWIAGTVLLYVPCRWFAGVKARRHDWWLGYL